MSEESLFYNEATTPTHPPVARSASKNSIRWSMAAGRALNMSQSSERDDSTEEGTPEEVVTRQNRTPEGSDRFSSFNKRRSSQKLLEDINQSLQVN